MRQVNNAISVSLLVIAVIAWLPLVLTTPGCARPYPTTLEGPAAEGYARHLLGAPTLSELERRARQMVSSRNPTVILTLTYAQHHLRPERALIITEVLRQAVYAPEFWHLLNQYWRHRDAPQMNEADRITRLMYRWYDLNRYNLCWDEEHRRFTVKNEVSVFRQ